MLSLSKHARRRSKSWTARLLLSLLACPAAAAPAWAHASDRGFVLLLPTGYYIIGGTLAVAASFLLLLFLPDAALRRLGGARVSLVRLPALSATVTGALASLFLVLLLLTGFYGSRDPLENPLPLTVWTLWWVGLTIAQALLGDLWSLLNPWIAPCRLLRRLGGKLSRVDEPPFDYPRRLGYWPAALGFFAFAWFELIDPAPNDPARLALAILVYSALTLTGMLLFGERAWLARGECFSVFFSFVALLSPLRVARSDAEGGGHRLFLAFPGAALAKRDPLPIGGVLFLLLTLAAVSFDGLSKTFWWLGLGGINPLEFPGRTAVMGRNTLGLAAMAAALALAYGLAIALGSRLALHRLDRQALGAFVLSLLPISIGYHFAHYLTTFLVNGQYALLALNDPLGRGWDIFNLGHPHVTVSFLSSYDAVSIIWKLQAAGVVAGHILAVSLAHLIALARLGTGRAALMSQLPLAALMIAYTLFGLWLLAAPTAG